MTLNTEVYLRNFFIIIEKEGDFFKNLTEIRFKTAN